MSITTTTTSNISTNFELLQAKLSKYMVVEAVDVISDNLSGGTHPTFNVLYDILKKQTISKHFQLSQAVILIM